jgi:phosphonate utilization transcriptional regulator
MIVAGDLPAGAKLTEASVAELLGVSRGPIREAFRALQETGLVRFEKNRGVYVRQISIDEADQIYEVRAALDAFAARKLAGSASPAQVRALRALLARMDRAAAESDVETYSELNVAFHDKLVSFAGNSKLLATYRRLVNELALFRRTTLARAGTLPTSTREHRAIVDAIAAGDADGAARALHDHVMASRERMHRTQQEVPRPLALAARRSPR